MCLLTSFLRNDDYFPVVDYVCPRAPPPMPNPTVLTAPRGIAPDFAGDAFAFSQLSTPSAYSEYDQLPEQTRFALEIAKLKPTFIYVAPSAATTTTALSLPPRSTTLRFPRRRLLLLDAQPA